MSNHREYQGLRFTRPSRLIPPRVIFIGISLIIFTFFWLLLPISVMYWLLLVGLAVLIWVATYGWRSALTNFIHFLRNLEKI